MMTAVHPGNCTACTAHDMQALSLLAAGCFWPAQEPLRHREGVISTRVGYGTLCNVTLHCSLRALIARSP